MKYIIIGFLVVAGLALGQNFSGEVDMSSARRTRPFKQVASAPSGACFASEGWQENIADGKLYRCLLGLWAEFTSGSGGGSWGSITGTLAGQTDLATALNGKEPTIAAGTSGQYWRGDKTWVALPSKPPQYCIVSNGVVYGSSPASGWTIPTQANMPQPVVVTAGGGTTATEAALQFTTTNTFVEMQCPISPDYNASGTASIWMSLTSVQTSTNITFDVQQCVVDTGDASSCTYGGAQTITVTPQGTTLRRNVGVLANLTKTNWAANETLKIKLTLTASTGNVNLHWFRLSVPQL